MAFISTTDHDEIRNWMTAHDGRPAVLKGTVSAESRGAVLINFEENNPDVENITWDEFFDWFEENNYKFNYDPDLFVPGEEDLSFNFTDRSVLEEGQEDETELPEENEMADENMFPDDIRREEES